ncbi:MAG TPA: DUF4177 domain-containing protein [Anaerolineae bacterium]|nr:DUF4177 domain-containing protein [Anaerolineae bacterium]
MYEYEFVRIKTKWHILKQMREPTEDYQKIINTYAQNGYRLVQVLAPPLFSTGHVPYFELIFERPAQ